MNADQPVKRGPGRDVLDHISYIELLLRACDGVNQSPPTKARLAEARRTGRTPLARAWKRGDYITPERFIRMEAKARGLEFYPGFLDHPTTCLNGEELAP